MVGLTLAAYTHFGARGLRGIGMYHLVKEAWRRGTLQRVIAVSKKRCQFEFDLSLVETLPGESRIINGLGQIKNKFWRSFPSRWFGEMIFDRYAASRLAGPGGTLIMTPGMISTAKKAKALGYRTLIYGGIPHPKYFVEQIQIEMDTFGLKGGEEITNRPWMMTRLTAHLERSDFIIANSEFAKETYVTYGFPAERIFVAPTGVDLKKFNATPPPPQDSRFTYLFVAHVNGTTGILKGFQYLLRAWSELGLENARLLVCGKIGLEGQALIRQYDGKLHNAEFTGYVSDPKEYYRQSSVFVFPSLAEGMAKVILEAMATGRPVIVTPNSGAVARSGIDGFYVPPRDVEALKERMLYFHRNREEVARMGTNAIQQAERFSWERFSRQIADIVAEVSAN